MIKKINESLRICKKYKFIIFSIILIILISILIYLNFMKNNIEKEIIVEDQKETIIVQEATFKEQLDNILLNIEELEGSRVEIEGFFMSQYGTNLVSRYGPGCCEDDAYLYMRFIYDEELNINQIEDWIRVSGTLTTKYDETTKVTFIYIDADNVEILDERGNDTITKRHLLEGEI